MRYSGERRSFHDEVSNLQFVDFNDQARSLRVQGRGAWQICVDANFQNCVTVSRDVPDLDRMGMARRISSVRPETTEPAALPAARRLTRSATDRKIAGVCGGLAEYFGVDATPIRLLWAILSIFCGAVIGGVIAYVVAWAIIPRSPETSLTTPSPAAVT